MDNAKDVAIERAILLNYLLFSRFSTYEQIKKDLNVSDATIAKMSNLVKLIQDIVGQEKLLLLGDVDEGFTDKFLAVVCSEIDNSSLQRLQLILKKALIRVVESSSMTKAPDINEKVKETTQNIFSKDVFNKLTDDAKKARIRSALIETNNNITYAAKLLGMTVQHLRRLKKKYGI